TGTTIIFSFLNYFVLLIAHYFSGAKLHILSLSTKLSANNSLPIPEYFSQKSAIFSLLGLPPPAFYL
ncbi:MAG: hypothetical protein LUE93_04925, partial [Bacteroides sp.]|nr:hypothetical protein [Bacteroides sp.]